MSLAMVEQTLQRAFEQFGANQAQTAQKLAVEALGQLELLRRDQRGAQAQDLACAERAVRDELTALEDLEAELARIQRQKGRAKSIEDEEPSGEYRPSSRNTPPNRNIIARARQQPAAAAPRGAPKNPGAATPGNRRDYDRPWAERRDDDRGGADRGAERHERKDARRGAAAAPAAPGARQKKEALPTSYDGIDSQFVEQIHSIMIKNTGRSYDDIAGLEDSKRLLDEAILLPMKVPELFNQ